MAKKHFPLDRLKKEECAALYKSQVQSLPLYQKHIKQVAKNLNIESYIIDDVISYYFIFIMTEINTVRRYIRKINIYAYLCIYVIQGNKTIIKNEKK